MNVGKEKFKEHFTMNRLEGGALEQYYSKSTQRGGEMGSPGHFKEEGVRAVLDAANQLSELKTGPATGFVL